MRPEEVVANVLGVSPHEIEDDTSNESIAEWDSLAHMNLVLELEATYGVALSADEALEITNVAAIKRVLSERGATWQE